MRYYIESDGRVYLVDRDGRLDLPTRDEIPFPIVEEGPLPTSEPTTYCLPELPGHPWEWPEKDVLAGVADGVTPLVREAIHGGMPRVVVEGIVVRDGALLLVKGSRGLTEGRWSLPGGFLRFGEDPRQGLARELREELRVEARIDALLDLRGKLGRASRMHWVMAFYRASFSGEVDPDPDEIAEARFVPLPEAHQRVRDGLMREVIAGLPLQ
jgi:8-oxo-dGTP diphosphatase